MLNPTLHSSGDSNRTVLVPQEAGKPLSRRDDGLYLKCWTCCIVIAVALHWFYLIVLLGAIKGPGGASSQKSTKSPLSSSVAGFRQNLVEWGQHNCGYGQGNAMFDSSLPPYVSHASTLTYRSSPPFRCLPPNSRVFITKIVRRTKTPWARAQPSTSNAQVWGD
jgi:hypothetical protein